jgi:hypothetical protein
MSGERRCPNCLALIPQGHSVCPKCKPEDEKTKIVLKPTLVTSLFIAEQVWNREQQPKYLIYHFDEDRFEEKEQIHLGEFDHKDRKIVYVPVNNEALQKGLVITPSGIQNTSFKELLERADKFAGLPNYDACGQDAMVRFLVRVAVGSWFLDRFVDDPCCDVAGAGKFAPIIPIRGPSQSGKNRLAFVLRMLMYRPYFEMSTYRVPSLYRPLDMWQGGLVLDEADFTETSERSELVHFINCRATGTPISRQDPQDPRITHTFTNFGLTVLTQRRTFDDNATESRCIPFYSESTNKKLPTVETDEMLKEGLELQNMLLYLRMKYYRQVKINKSMWLNGAGDPRLMASLLPLIALCEHEPAIKEQILPVIRDVEKLKVEQKANSEDGSVINYLWEMISEDLFSVWNDPHYYVLTWDTEDEENKVTIPLTTSKMADDLKWTARNVKKVLKSLNISASGLPQFVKVGNKSWRVVFFDPDKFEKRLREFVIEYNPNTLRNLVSAKYGQTALKVTEVTEVTDKLHGEISGEQQEPRLDENAPCIRSVTSVTSVTEKVQEPDQISLRADSCEFWRTPKCVAGVPSSIFAHATCPETCKNYQKRSQ